MIQKIKNFLRKNVVIPESDKIKIQAIESEHEKAERKVLDLRIKNRREKAEQYIEHFNNELNKLIGVYFRNFSLSCEDNKIAFESLNRDWKEYARRANMLQEIVKVPSDAFEKGIQSVISRNKQFIAVDGKYPELEKLIESKKPKFKV